MMDAPERGVRDVQARLSILEAMELLNAVQQFRVFSNSKQASSAILDAGFDELVDAAAHAIVADPESHQDSSRVSSLTSPTPEELEKAMATLEESAKKAKKLPPVSEPRGDEERLERKERWDRMAEIPASLVRRRVKELLEESGSD